MNLKTPLVWDNGKINELIDAASGTDSQIKEMYGCLPILLSGRPSGQLESVPLEKARDVFKHIKSRSIRSNYLFNAVYSKDQITEDILNTIKKIVNTLEPNQVTIASPELREKFSEMFPDISIIVSTVQGVKTKKHIDSLIEEKERGINLSGVCLHHDCTISRDLLEITRHTKKAGLETSILVNENCVYECAYRTPHYIHTNIAHHYDHSDKFLNHCVRGILKEPWKLVGLAGMVRPEDTSFYENMGIDIFKIAGRDRPIDWMKKVIRAYATHSYEGNLIELLVFTIPPGKDAKEVFYVNNKKIRSISERWVNNPIEDMKKEAERLFENGDLRVTDKKSEYRIKNGIVKNITPGKYMQSIPRERL